MDLELAQGALSEEWMNELEDGLNCNSCYSVLNPKTDFPLYGGNCPHTICKSCFEGMRKMVSSVFADCPVAPDTCRKYSFPVNPPRENMPLMLGLTYLSQCREAATGEMKTLHSNWSAHVKALTSELKDLQGQLSNSILSKEKLQLKLEEVQSNLEKMEESGSELKELRSKLDNSIQANKEVQQKLDDQQAKHREDLIHLNQDHEVWVDSRKQAEVKIGKLASVLRAAEKGTKNYYLRCPNCQKHLEVVRRSKITNSVPCFGDATNSSWGEVNYNIPLTCITSRAEFAQTEGYQKMRIHLKRHCLKPKTLFEATEAQLPFFYSRPYDYPASWEANPKRKRQTED